MTLEDQFSEALQEVLRDNPGISQAEAERMASELVTPAGEPDRYVSEQLSSLGGFIGDPSKPGSNRFSTAAQPNGISSWSAPQPLPPWMVQQAGTANDLPGVNPIVAEDFKDAYGKDPRELFDEGKLAVAAVKGAAGDVPEQAVNALEQGYSDAFDRYTKIVRAGADPAETETALYGPLRAQAKALTVENRYQNVKPTGDPEETRLRKELLAAEKDLKDQDTELKTKSLPIQVPVPAKTNWFGRITPAATDEVFPFEQGDINKSTARYNAAMSAYEQAQKNYMDYVQKYGKPSVSGNGFALQSGTATNSPLKIGRFTVTPK